MKATIISGTTKRAEFFKIEDIQGKLMRYTGSGRGYNIIVLCIDKYTGVYMTINEKQFCGTLNSGFTDMTDSNNWEIFDGAIKISN